MNHDELLRALTIFRRRRPFKSFKIEFVSGDSFQVLHPEAIRPSGKLFIHIAPDRLVRVFDASAVSHFKDEPKKGS